MAAKLLFRRMVVHDVRGGAFAFWLLKCTVLAAWDHGRFSGPDFDDERGSEDGLLEGTQGGYLEPVPCKRDVDARSVRPFRRFSASAHPLEVRLRGGGGPSAPARAGDRRQVRGPRAVGVLPPRDQARGRQAARRGHEGAPRGQAAQRGRRRLRPPVGLQAGGPRRARRPLERRRHARGSCYDVRAGAVDRRGRRAGGREQDDRLPLAGQGRHRQEALEDEGRRRAHGEGEGRGAGRVGAGVGRAARGRSRGAGARGGGPARRGAGGVGRPKSTRPGLFEQRGEAPGGREGEGGDAEGEGA